MVWVRWRDLVRLVLAQVAQRENNVEDYRFVSV